MAKNPAVSDEVKLLIAKLHNDHPEWTNTMIRNEVLSAVHKRNPSLPKGWPSKFVIDRIMPGVRERVKRAGLERNPIDQPWTVQSMADSKYEIPPEALPSVLRVWFLTKQKGWQFSIRQAQWVGRLYAAITDIEALYGYSVSACFAEMLAEFGGIEGFVGYEPANLFVFSTMTGQVISREEAERIAGISKKIRPKSSRPDPIPWLEGMFAGRLPKGFWGRFPTAEAISDDRGTSRKGDSK
jgi:hypothetical protein